jgi:hypothetical protein
LSGVTSSSSLRPSRSPTPAASRRAAFNRVEYGYSVHALAGANCPPAADFMQDDSGYGIDTIGDA